MTPVDLHALKELAAQFRQRAKAVGRLSHMYDKRGDEALTQGESINHYIDAARCEGKRQAHSNDADDLERVIREAEAVGDDGH